MARPGANNLLKNTTLSTFAEQSGIVSNKKQRSAAGQDVSGLNIMGKKMLGKKMAAISLPMHFLPRTFSLLKRRIDGGGRANSTA